MDRLTQIQDTINQQAEYFCNSIGILQQYATSSKFSGFDHSGSQTPQPQEVAMLKYAHRGVRLFTDYAQLFATLIGRNAKDIDTMIESLPNEESSPDLQMASLKKLEQDNKEATERLEDIVRKGEDILDKIQDALADIAQSQLEMQSSSGKSPKNSSL